LPIRLKEELFTENYLSTGWLEGSDNTNKILQRYFYLHRLDFTLYNKISISLMEGMLAGNSAFELRYFNPIIIFHDLFAWNDFSEWGPQGGGSMIGSFASIEVNWNIFKNLSVYGQFVMNELTLPGESDGNPSGLGWMAGVQYAHSFNSWASVSFLEFIYTDPYLSILSSPLASFIQMDRGENYYFIGYPRDTIAITGGTNFFYTDTLFFSGSFSWISSGQHNNNESTNGIIWNWGNSSKERNERTPTGTAENKFIISLSAGWKPNDLLVLKADITGIISINNNHNHGDTALGGQASFSVGLRY